MFQEDEKEWILEAINHLKHRKARPDLSRISLRMKRKYFMSFAQTKKLLESLIESGIVVKAVYKNNTSYRDVSKWKKGRLGGQILNSNKMLKRFIRAIEAIEKTKGTGVLAKDIEEYLGSQGEEKCFLSGPALRDALENEICNGYLKRTFNGTRVHYTINSDNIENVHHFLQEDENSQLQDFIIDSNSTSTPQMGLLLTSVLAAINETERSEDMGSTLLDIKEILILKGIRFSDDIFLSEFLENSTKKGVLTKSFHDSVTYYAENKKFTKQLEIGKGVIDSSPEGSSGRHFNLEKIKDSGDETSRSDSIVSKCQQEYVSKHAQQAVPLRPPSKRKRIVKDHGPDFEIEMPTKVKTKFSENKDSVYPTPSDSPASEKSDLNMYQSFNFDKKKRGRPKKNQSQTSSIHNDHMEEDSKQGAPSEVSTVEEDDTSITYPDIAAWSSEQVASYFSNKGYFEEAQSMLENDLDGTALGLLKRSDIVGPPLGGILKVKKLGVALKLFRDIRDLLYQGNSDNYLDPYEEKPFLRS
ncbi:unnamed protein product [Lymnaea stagnalis]|uniref:SAMD1-like winged helix (WH) domain-containing protein n=1 Tax=Lymnaea stagnalis TaxID=6523 RepID=A0AAV2I6R4_LYMST